MRSARLLTVSCSARGDLTPHLTIRHGDLFPSPPPWTSDLGTYHPSPHPRTLDLGTYLPASDIWWWSPETCSNFIIWGPTPHSPRSDLVVITETESTYGFPVDSTHPTGIPSCFQFTTHSTKIISQLLSQSTVGVEKPIEGNENINDLFIPSKYRSESDKEQTEKIKNSKQA